MAKYTVCGKCGQRHSTLVPHKCFKTKDAPPPPKSDGGEEEDLGEDGGKGGGESGQGQNKQQDGDEGQQGQGDGEGEGQSQGEQGEGDGDEEQEGGGEAPVPQLPEPDAPIVQIVCTVLKFAALTAACAKNGVIEVTLNEDGLFVYGHNGDSVAFEIIPWGEFEQRSTLDGEFYVKEIIDNVDARIIDATAKVISQTPVKKAAKAKPKKEAKPKLTLPLTVGQMVKCEDGAIRTVESRRPDSCYGDICEYEDGTITYSDTGRMKGKGRTDLGGDDTLGAVCDA